MEELPYSSEELIETLHRENPIVNPTVTDTMEVIQRRAGRRDVIDNLLVMLQRQRSDATKAQEGG